MSIFIIAEAGVNHNGDLCIAKQMIDAAAYAGVDAVKFQSFRAEKVVCRNAKKAAYQVRSTGSGESQQQMLKKLELDVGAHKELMRYCRLKNILFLSTPFDTDSMQMLYTLGMRIFKIPSGEITNLPYLRAVASLKEKIILSTGMSSLDEVGRAISILRENGTSDISILQCNTEYPTPMEDVNLRAMLTMKAEFSVPVGYSDHTAGIEIPIAAAAMGAEIIEKHFTLSKSMEGPDHKASLEPDELKNMVKCLRNVEKALGNGKKYPSPSEVKNKEVVRRSIVANTKIHRGDLFSEKNLTVKRPGTGISPMRWDEIIGRIATHEYEAEEMIEI